MIFHTRRFNMSDTVKKPSYNKKPVTKSKEEERKHTGTNYSARTRNTKVVIQEVKKLKMFLLKLRLLK